MSKLFEIIRYTSFGMTTIFFIIGVMCVAIFGHYLLLEYIYPKILRQFKVYGYFVAFIKFRKDFEQFWPDYRNDIVARQGNYVKTRIIWELANSVSRLLNGEFDIDDDAIELHWQSLLKSIGDTQTDEQVLEVIKHFNETGKLFEETL